MLLDLTNLQSADIRGRLDDLIGHVRDLDAEYKDEGAEWDRELIGVTNGNHTGTLSGKARRLLLLYGLVATALMSLLEAIPDESRLEVLTAEEAVTP